MNNLSNFEIKTILKSLRSHIIIYEGVIKNLKKTNASYNIIQSYCV